MNNENYELFGLDESASDEQIKERYSQLKKKYNEDRWLEGEAGNEAARMLGKIDVAYTEIMKERREKERTAEAADSESGDSAYKAVADAIKNGDLVGAQKMLDEANDRNAEWHYLQSVLFYRKNWINESKKQLEIAMQMDSANGKYKEAYERLNKRTNYQEQNAGRETAQNVNQTGDQMGGNGCVQCLDCCYTYLCVNCLFNLCCGCR